MIEVVKPKVLHADDDEVIRYTVSNVFNRLLTEFELLPQLRNGNSLERALQNGRMSGVKLVVSDNQMPGTNGSDVINRYSHRYLGVEFLLYYAGDAKIGEDLCRGKPNVHYFEKNGEVDELVSFVRGIIYGVPG